MKRLACASVLAGALCLLAGSPSDARAAPRPNPSGPQLSVLTPDSSTIDARFSLDVSFRGGAVDSVELYMDGALVAKRQISTAQSRGVISFMLDATQLTEGSHDLLVRALGVDGKATTASAKIRIPALDLNAPVRIAYPQNGIQVSGIVPIRVAVDSDLRSQKPYVTFFVDRELKVLRNFPPYEYNWDTTKVENGWHVVEAWTQTPDAIAPTKARPVHVNVNNATGETKRLDKIEDLRAEAPSAEKQAITMKPGSAVDPSSAKLGGAAIRPEVDAAVPTISSRLQPGSVSGARATEPSSIGYGLVTKPSVPAPGFTVPTARSSRPSARMMGGAAIRPSNRIAIAAGPRPVLPRVGETGGIYPVIEPTHPGSGLLKVQPGETLAGISQKSGVNPTEIARLNNLRPGQALPAGGSLIVPRTGSFDVAFDGVQIAFDVQPRIEAGVKLAPFRQIFEHTGGRLYWFNTAKTVRAVNSSREIEIRIGKKSALVNNESVGMEHKPFIDSGRTIVPMSFIRDSLNVRINYDARSGRLLIESK